MGRIEIDDRRCSDCLRAASLSTAFQDICDRACAEKQTKKMGEAIKKKGSMHAMRPSRGIGAFKVPSRKSPSEVALPPPAAHGLGAGPQLPSSRVQQLGWPPPGGIVREIGVDSDVLLSDVLDLGARPFPPPQEAAAKQEGEESEQCQTTDRRTDDDANADVAPARLVCWLRDDRGRHARCCRRSPRQR